MATAQQSAASNRLRELGLDREDALQMYRHMLITRGVEERGHILYRQGKIPGSFYTGRGNEGASVGAAWAIRDGDLACALHRDMGVHIARGLEPWRIFAQYMGRVDGPTKGRDGNVHLADIRLGMITMVSHLPAMLPVAVGCALAFRIREEAKCAFAWSGDGATARGDFHEGVNLAAVRKLPCVFIIDNNQWAYSTPRHLGFNTPNVSDRAAGYGVPSVVVDGTDILASFEAVRDARERAVAGEGPTVIELVTLRMEGHAVHDDAFYVPKEDFEVWSAKDPIERFRTFLIENTGLTDDEDEQIRAGVKRLLTEQLEKAEASPEPDPESAMGPVFASPEEMDNPHH